MLEDVYNEHFLSLQIDRRQNFCQKLPRLTNEWPAGRVLIGTGSLADTNEIRVDVALARNAICRGRVQRATCALLNFLGYRIQRGKLRDEIRHHRDLRGTDYQSLLERRIFTWRTGGHRHEIKAAHSLDWRRRVGDRRIRRHLDRR